MGLRGDWGLRSASTPATRPSAARCRPRSVVAEGRTRRKVSPHGTDTTQRLATRRSRYRVFFAQSRTSAGPACRQRRYSANGSCDPRKQAA